MNKSIEVLKKFQDWRTGKDERTMKEAGIHPSDVTAAIDDVIGMHIHLVVLLDSIHDSMAGNGEYGEFYYEAKELLEKTK